MERWHRRSVSPVETTLEKLKNVDYHADDYLWRIRSYLDEAHIHGLHSQTVVDSCVDLAETYADIPELFDIHQAKQSAWDTARQRAVSAPRDPIEINMELDPVYFEAILLGYKTYEGRAYKPDSDKNYHDMRANDRIRFRLSRRREEFTEDIMRRGLNPRAYMICTVGDIHFSPTVHGMYQIPRFYGLDFQPMINGPSELIQLQRAAVYHAFPGYHALIQAHGFLGIQLRHPRLLE